MSFGFGYNVYFGLAILVVLGIIVAIGRRK